MSIPNLQLNNGLLCPQLGLGTWQSSRSRVSDAVKYAIDIGYRHIDCAMVFGNESEIGRGIMSKIAEGVVKREDLFIVTKLWNFYHEYNDVVPTCRKSLHNFGLEYVDLYLIHWPVAQKIVSDSTNKQSVVGYYYDYLDTWRGMEECVKRGLTKSIGVSNFNSKQIENVLNVATIKPVINQVEVNPNLNQRRLIKFCNDRGVHIIAHAPLGSPGRPWKHQSDQYLRFDNAKLVKIANNHNKSAAQVMLRYIVQLGCIPVPKSINFRHIKENIEIFDFELSKEDMNILDSFNKIGRVITAGDLTGLPHYPFDEAF